MMKRILIFLLLAVPGYSVVRPFAEISYSPVTNYHLGQLATKNYMSGSLMLGFYTYNLKIAADVAFGTSTCFDSLLNSGGGPGTWHEDRLISRIRFLPIGIMADYIRTFHERFTIDAGPEVGVLFINENFATVNKSGNSGAAPWESAEKNEFTIEKKRTTAFILGGNISLWIGLTNFLKVSVGTGYQYSRTSLKGMKENEYKKFMENSDFRMSSPKLKLGLMFLIPK